MSLFSSRTLRIVNSILINPDQSETKSSVVKYGIEIPRENCNAVYDTQNQKLDEDFSAFQIISDTDVHQSEFDLTHIDETFNIIETHNDISGLSTSANNCAVQEQICGTDPQLMVANKGGLFNIDDTFQENSEIFDCFVNEDGSLILNEDEPKSSVNISHSDIIDGDISAEDTDNSSETLLSLQRKIKNNKEKSKQSAKERTRCKQRHVERWKKNINKKNMNECKPYSNENGKICTAKCPKDISCGAMCRFKCNTHFTKEDRINICHEYWGLTTYERKKDFILKNVDVKSPESRRPRQGIDSKKRKNAKKYHFFKDKVKIRVCQSFFMKTLSINNGPIITAFKHRSSLGLFNGQDKRGKGTPSNKTKPSDVSIVKRHIESFPRMESHYSRKCTKRMYLDSKLSISKMYALYNEFCTEYKYKPVSQAVYRKIFCTCYNLSFFVPKKDQCPTCARYNNSLKLREQVVSTEDEYRAHIQRKVDAAKAKELDKEQASSDSGFISATFDLQSVLQIPSSDVSPMYYSRKINMYNLTVYEAALPNKAYCFCWTELNGKRGSSEIGSCLYKWFRTLYPDVKHVSLFSDTCGGQNRNQNIVALMLYLSQITDLEVIEHKFLESGHSYMEVDSMHSSIEREKKNSPVYVVHDWLNIFRRARSTRNRNKTRDAYVVTELKLTDFIDLQDLSRTLIKNKTFNVNNEKVNWLKVKCFRFQKALPYTIEYRYDYFGDYKQIDIRGRVWRVQNIEMQKFELKNLYTKCLPISEEKKANLLQLCKKETIPIEYHGWYNSLPTFSSSAAEEVPEPGVDDSDAE